MDYLTPEDPTNSREASERETAEAELSAMCALLQGSRRYEQPPAGMVDPVSTPLAVGAQGGEEKGETPPEVPPGRALISTRPLTRVEIPADIAAVVYGLPSSGVRRLRERLLYIASLVCDPRRCKEDNEYRTNLSSQVLDQVCGVRSGRKCYRDLLTELEMAGVLEIGTRYRPATKAKEGKAKEYRCRIDWQGLPRVRIELGTVDLTRRQQTLRTALASSDAAVRYLAACFVDSDLDVRHALSIICARYRLPPELAEGALDDAHYGAISTALAGNGRGQWGVSAVWQSYVDRDTWFARDKTGRRLHSPATNLPRYLRPALRLRGDDRLVGLDLRCSQLVFGAALMLGAGLAHHQDVALFIDSACTGDLYRVTYAACHDGALPTEEQRDEWKRLIFQHWWYPNTHWQRSATNPIASLLTAAFPNVSDWILEQKRRAGYAGFPIDLQRRESAVFIDSLALALRDAEIPVLTIHDSIVVRERDEQRAHALLLEALAPLGLDLRTQVKREVYCLDLPS